jgi:hypothetical protein
MFAAASWRTADGSEKPLFAFVRNEETMDMVTRWRLQGRILGAECWWIPLAASLMMVVVLRTGGDQIASEKALWLWSELILPLIGIILAAFHAGQAADTHKDVVLTAGPAGRRAYAERYMLLLGGLFLMGWLANGLLAAALHLQPALLIAARVSIFSLPVLLFFSALAVTTADGRKSASTGALFAGGVWLLFILLSVLAKQTLWEPVYPFLGYFVPSAKGFLLNRCLLLSSVFLIVWQAWGWSFGAYSRSTMKFCIRNLFLLPLGLGLALGAVNSGPRLFSPPPQTRDARWQQEVRFLEHELIRRHANALNTVTAEDFHRTANDLSTDVPALSDDEILVRLMEWVAMIGDAHTQVDLSSVPHLHIYPLKLQWFQDGLFVVGAGPEYTSLIGARVLQIGDHNVEDAYQAISTLIPHANEGRLRDKSTDYLISAEILRGLGLTSKNRTGQFTLKTSKGDVIQMDLVASLRSDLEQWTEFPGDGQLYRQRADLSFWFELLPDTQTLYFKYNRCAGRNEFAAMNQALWNVIHQSQPTRLLIDFRNNRGGDSLVFAPFLKELAQHPEYNRPDRLFVIINESVFSSALINAVQLRQNTSATFIGSEAGDWINHYGEVETIVLPYHRIKVGYATREFSFAAQQDQRLVPDNWVTLSSQAFFSHRDPLIEAILPKR